MPKPANYRARAVPNDDGTGTATCSCGWTVDATSITIARRSASVHRNNHRKERAVIADVEWLIECHVGLSEAARRLGYRTPGALDRWLTRHGQEHLAAKLRGRDWLPLEPGAIRREVA